MQRKVSIPVDADALPAIFFYPDETITNQPAVLFLHGWQSNQSRYVPKAEALTKLGYICLTFTRRDYRPEKNIYQSLTIQDHFHDVLAVYTFLRAQQAVDQTKISVVGASYGGYLASVLAGEKPVYSLVLRAPALYPDEKYLTPKIQVKVKDYPNHSFSPKNNKALRALAAYRHPVLLTESEYDEAIPYTMIEAYRNALQNNKEARYSVMAGANHALKGDREQEWQEEFSRLLIDWFTKLK